MEEVLREYVSGILVKKLQGKFHIQMLDESWHNFFDDDPLVLLDGVPIFDINKIIEMDPFKVKKIELRNRQYFLGPITSDGIISYSTYKGDLARKARKAAEAARQAAAPPRSRPLAASDPSGSTPGRSTRTSRPPRAPPQSWSCSSPSPC